MPSVEKMTTPNPSNNYQIKVNQHPDEGELGIDIYPPNNVEAAAAAANIDTMEIEKDEEDAAATASSNSTVASVASPSCQRRLSSSLLLYLCWA